jgi:hypothetical protein
LEKVMAPDPEKLERVSDGALPAYRGSMLLLASLDLTKILESAGLELVKVLRARFGTMTLAWAKLAGTVVAIALTPSKR